MRKNKNLALVVASLFLATLWGCGSNMDSGGDQTGAGGGTVAAKVGSDSCKVCHTTIAVTEGFNGSIHDNDAVVGCEGCHGGGQFHKGIGPIPIPSPGPAKCTQCHTLAAIGHTDDAATPTIIEGLVVKTADINGCQVCHYSDHNPVLTINHEWSNSGHGGHLETGPVTSATADAWVHYDWDAANRASCQRCHTSTGISNFLTDPTTYNSANNDFSHLSGWTSTNKTSGQQEVLYCWGCHKDASEATTDDSQLRNPGAITENYAAVNNTTTGTTGTAATVVYPDVKASNVCIGCHLGREIGQNIKNITDADGILGFVNSHYLTAGATVFNKNGYEYAGQTYSTFGFHKNLGIDNNFNTGTSGPCAACHMSVASGHTFSFITKDVGGAIEANNSPICTNCHANMDGGTLDATKENFHVALEGLRLALEARGIFFHNAHPYFFTAPWIDYTPPAANPNVAFTNWESVATTLGVGLATDATGTGWKNVMGAAFNYNTFEHDPGAYAHNSDYALKLIADSIDFLTDGNIDGDGSFAATLIGQGMNIASGAGYSPIHDAPVAVAILSPTTSQATCSACHPAAPHYGGYPTGAVKANGDLVRFPQWVNNQVVSCSECHANNDPSLNQGVVTQYAQSGHGDVTGAWTHEEDGATCSRCHTTTGYINNLTDGTSFSYVDTDPLQVLNCNGCHSSIANGAALRRAPGAFVATWSSNSVTASVTYPNSGDSNLCIRCHSARRAGANITPLATTYAHYLPAAAIVFGGTAGLVTVTANTVADPNKIPAVGTQYTGGGYEFDGQTYAGLGSHKNINLGNTGPCVACHMRGTDAGHTWHAVTKDEVTGEVTAVNSSACSAVACHGATMTPAFLNTEKAAFIAAQGVLEAQLNARGIYLSPVSINQAYFFQDAAFTTAVNNAYYVTKAALAPAVSTRDLEGAAYNLWLFKNAGGDQGGYVHNPLYALKLLADSADLLNDGIINGN